MAVLNVDTMAIAGPKVGACHMNGWTLTTAASWWQHDEHCYNCCSCNSLCSMVSRCS